MTTTTTFLTPLEEAEKVWRKKKKKANLTKYKYVPIQQRCRQCGNSLDEMEGTWLGEKERGYRICDECYDHTNARNRLFYGKM